MGVVADHSLLAADLWQEKIFLSGSWQPSASGASYPVVEPATGGELGRIGQANADDVATAA